MYEGYRMGGVDFIYKPINPELLRYKVSVFVDLYRKTQQLLNHERKLLSINKKLEREIEERSISEEKIRLLNQQLVQNNAQLENTIEELDRFAYVASHDLQEPLRKILVFSDKIQTKYKYLVGEEINRNLDKIVRASERMHSLINDLLRFSRHTNSNDDFTFVNLNDLLTEVLLDLEIDVEKTEAQVIINQLPQVWAIPSQMRQLFQNLLSNAFKFRKKEAIPIVQIFNDTEVKDYHRIVIQDNGIGFDPKYAEEIFMVFKRLHSYHDFEGSGVGLSICKKIIDRHNGMIKAESKIGNGAKFIVDLPINQNKKPNTDKIESEKIKAVQS
jgi:light-regulated signal transduction histidine kinase (bacteriophytochrome)